MFGNGRVRVLALMLADAACVCGAWAFVVLGYRLFGGCYDVSLYLGFWPVVIAYVAVNVFLGLYHGNVFYPSSPCSPVDEFRQLFLSSFIVHIGVIAFLALHLQTTDGYSRVAITFSGVTVALTAQSFRNWMRRLLRRLDIAQIPVMLVGSTDCAERIASMLSADSYFGFRVVSRIDEEHLRDVVGEAKRLGIKILLSCQDVRFLRHQLDEFSRWFTYIDYFPSGETFPIFGLRAVSFDGIGGLEMVNYGRMKVKRLMKWLLDMALTVVVFVTLLPLFVILPVLIKLTGRGPVFYRQWRLGRNGKPFRVWKFRSMYADADERLEKVLADDPAMVSEWGRNHKLMLDPRVTPLGRFLRKTSLDELPQFFNVFAGSMALVGPRPIVAEEVKNYDGNYKAVSSVRPGITGLWQVSGRSDTDYGRRVALDLYYVHNWSPWMDIWILSRTAFAVVLMRGAR